MAKDRGLWDTIKLSESPPTSIAQAAAVNGVGEEGSMPALEEQANAGRDAAAIPGAGGLPAASGTEWHHMVASLLEYKQAMERKVAKLEASLAKHTSLSHARARSSEASTSGAAPPPANTASGANSSQKTSARPSPKLSDASTAAKDREESPRSEAYAQPADQEDPAEELRDKKTYHLLSLLHRNKSLAVKKEVRSARSPHARGLRAPPRPAQSR
eukprot:scaffold808_cov370-Prasinococcus_capsulatus_cf.AAC.27